MRAIAIAALVIAIGCGGQVEPTIAPTLCSVTSLETTPDGSQTAVTTHVGATCEPTADGGLCQAFAPCGGPVAAAVQVNGSTCGDLAPDPDVWCCWRTAAQHATCEGFLSSR